MSPYPISRQPTTGTGSWWPLPPILRPLPLSHHRPPPNRHPFPTTIPPVGRSERRQTSGVVPVALLSPSSEDEAASILCNKGTS